MSFDPKLAGTNMRDFEWRSEKALQSEVVARAAAVGGISIVTVVWLFIFGYDVAGLVLSILGVILTVAIVRTAGPTSVLVKGFDLHYGRSLKINLRGIIGVRAMRQFLVDDVFVLQFPGGHNVVPLRGVPQEVRDDLRAALEERISAG